MNHRKEFYPALKCLQRSMIRIMLLWMTAGAIRTPCTETSVPLPDSAAAQTMSLDVTNVDISDVIRMVSRGYNLSIVVDKNVKGPVSLHFTSVPIMEGVSAIAHSLGLEVVKTGNIYHLGEK